MEDRYLKLLEKSMDQNFSLMRDELLVIRKDLEEIKEFKWKITGIATFFSAILVAVVEIARRVTNTINT